MRTYNRHFNEAWEYLEQYHKPTTNRMGRKWEGFALSYTLDFTVKPNVPKAEWATYIDRITTVLTIGRRENFLNIHVDGLGRQIYWTVDKLKLEKQSSTGGVQ